MIKMYVMQTCPDCEYVEKQVEGNPNFEVIDIGKHVRNLKQFIKLRDSHPAFDEAKAVADSVLSDYFGSCFSCQHQHFLAIAIDMQLTGTDNGC